MQDVVIIGAGLAGLVCAQRLQQAGCRVVVVEKSRGLGGRVATRRLSAGANSFADYGVRCLEVQGKLSQNLIQALEKQNILHRWTDQIYQLNAEGLSRSPHIHPRYAASTGITAVAKFLATGLEVWRSQRVQAITPTGQTWRLTLEANTSEAAPEPLNAPTVVVAIPASQALTLLEPLAEDLPAAFLDALRSVEFAPCLSAIATYSPERQPDIANLPWRAVTFPQDLELAWVAIDSSKYPNPQAPVLVAQSTATFAQSYLEATDLHFAGQHLLDRAAQALLPWLNAPVQLQVHRWRYGFVCRPWPETYLSTLTPLPLLCSGDWCGGSQIENALRSGLDAATQVLSQFQETAKTSPEAEFARLVQSIKL
jgi:renalase